MQHSIARIIRAISFFLLVPVVAQAQGTGASEKPAPGHVDDQRLRAAALPDGNWITFGRDYSNQRFAPLTGIDRSNVARLAPAWVYPLGTTGSTQTHPIVVDGVMYVTMPGNDVAALNAMTGQQLWRYAHQPRGTMPRVPSNRGVAVAYGRVFVGTDEPV